MSTSKQPVQISTSSWHYRLMHWWSGGTVHSNSFDYLVLLTLRLTVFAAVILGIGWLVFNSSKSLWVVVTDRESARGVDFLISGLSVAVIFGNALSIIRLKSRPIIFLDDSADPENASEVEKP